MEVQEVINLVQKFLDKNGQSRPKVGLSQWQYNEANIIINAIKNGKRTILAEECARFGKTILSGVLVRELNSDITIIASYVLTSFTSFEKDFTDFEQFKNFVLIDSKHPNYKNLINNALKDKKQVVIFVSMCPGELRQDRLKFLFSLKQNRLVIIDEADYGVHCENQAKTLINLRHKNDVIILMTGTDSDRAVGHWVNDHYTSTTYPELLFHKKGLKNVPKYLNKLKYFDVDLNRHKLVVDIEFYQANLKSIVDFSLKKDSELFIDGNDCLPSWTKFAKNPAKAKGFWTNMIESMFLGKNGIDELNMDIQFNNSPPRIAMMFLPGNIKRENLKLAAQYAQEALPGFIVTYLNGYTTSNKDSEVHVYETIKNAERSGQSVLILSASMAQRSFSIGHITELYLAYDSGASAPTTQKIARVLTPMNEGKIGRVISLSFDPNRDDKFDTMILQTAKNIKTKYNIKTMNDALRQVLNTIDIFRCCNDKSLRIEPDEYIKQLLEVNRLSRVCGKIADMSQLSNDIVKALANNNIGYMTFNKIEKTESGKTFKDVKKNNKSFKKNRDLEIKDIEKARKAITMVVENLDILIKGSGKITLNEAFNIFDKDKEYQNAIENNFGMSYQLIKELFNRNIINQDIVDLMFYK